MERGDHKSLTASNNVIFICMDTKHVILASNYHEENEVALVSRRLKKWSTCYDQLSASSERLPPVYTWS